jgi:hypothetical protein
VGRHENGHSSNSSNDGGQSSSQKEHNPNAVCNKLEKVVQQINGTLKIDGGVLQNGK